MTDGVRPREVYMHIVEMKRNKIISEFIPVPKRILHETKKIAQKSTEYLMSSIRRVELNTFYELLKYDSEEI